MFTELSTSKIELKVNKEKIDILEKHNKGLLNESSIRSERYNKTQQEKDILNEEVISLRHEIKFHLKNSKKLKADNKRLLSARILPQ